MAHPSRQSELLVLLQQVSQLQIDRLYPYSIITLSKQHNIINYKIYLTVCSERLILTNECPLARARAATRLVLPTPGAPSSNSGLPNCMALNNLKAL